MATGTALTDRVEDQETEGESVESRVCIKEDPMETDAREGGHETEEAERWWEVSQI
jgi:hypothetical protein